MHYPSRSMYPSSSKHLPFDYDQYIATKNQATRLNMHYGRHQLYTYPPGHVCRCVWPCLRSDLARLTTNDVAGNYLSLINVTSNISCISYKRIHLIFIHNTFKYSVMSSIRYSSDQFGFFLEAFLDLVALSLSVT